MTAVALREETNSYWNLIKDTGYEVKLALIQKLTEALIPVVRDSDKLAEETTTPIPSSLRRQINKARKEYAEGKTITCRTPQEMQQFFDSL